VNDVGYQFVAVRRGRERKPWVTLVALKVKLELPIGDADASRGSAARAAL